jgi:hypothetical protein
MHCKYLETFPETFLQLEGLNLSDGYFPWNTLNYPEVPSLIQAYKFFVIIVYDRMMLFQPIHAN